MTGERCLANDIVLVEAEVHDEFVDRSLAAANDQVVGYGLADETDVGAIVSADHERTVREYISTGLNEGPRCPVTAGTFPSEL